VGQLYVRENSNVVLYNYKTIYTFFETIISTAMKKITRFSIIGILISLILLIFKDSNLSKILATCALIIFAIMFFYNVKKKH
jgi:hypothetical protein